MLPGANRDPLLHGLRLTRSTSSGQAPPPLQQERRLGESLAKSNARRVAILFGRKFFGEPPNPTRRRLLHASFGQRQNEAALLIPVRFGFALLFLTLLLLPGRVAAIHSRLRMIRAHLVLRMVRWSLHHPVLSVGRSCVPRRFARMSFGLSSLKVLLVPVKIFGRVLVAVLSSIGCSCSRAAMFRYRPGFVFSFPCSRCSP